MTCRHCHRLPGHYSRGLCQSCFQTPEILELYPPKIKTDPYKNFRKNYEPTMAELDAMIAERYPTMPARGVNEE